MVRLLPLLLLAAATSPAPFTVDTRGFATLQVAVDAIGEGSALIAVRGESHTYPSAGLRIEDNQATLGARQRQPTTVVADWSHERLMLSANRLGAGVKPFDLR